MTTNGESFRRRLNGFTNARNCLQIILGRYPIGPHEVKHYSEQSTGDIIRSLTNNAEFRVEVELPLINGESSSSNRFSGQPTERLRKWTGQKIELTSNSLKKINQAHSWQQLLTIIWKDKIFQNKLDPERFSSDRLQSFIEKLEKKEHGKLIISKYGQTRSVQVMDSRVIIMEIPASIHDNLIKYDNFDIGQIVRLIDVRRERRRFYPKSTDPQIYLPGLPEGQYKLFVKIHFFKIDADQQKDYFQIFFDFGQGFNEDESVKYPINSRDLRLALHLDAQRQIHGIRIDPINKNTDFFISSLTFVSVHGEETSNRKMEG